ncbi:hypothetical protein V511_02785 [Mesotoga sp. Brook.08.YT.4.2.5.1]|nr:hypothetical protein V511_02785 [Mesotoga sp. Brook.08.YT.4.2.5.1]PVD17129.1 hypothetical protein V512_009390 [Mesotoga sp. Brook.08.105.5.1]RAO96185.1 hypothetical protein M388_14940 [Mesotoga sp. Brook.08.YT.4.2.5.4.]RDI93375.1 hypothetical protein Q502_06015 [Mesotoga sp. Brook.08.YT.4.2.5.2.]
MVGKNERTWLTVERFFEENPLFVPERLSVLRSWLRQKTTNGIMIFDLIQGRVYALGRRTALNALTRPETYYPRSGSYQELAHEVSERRT